MLADAPAAVVIRLFLVLLFLISSYHFQNVIFCHGVFCGQASICYLKVICGHETFGWNVKCLGKPVKCCHNCEILAFGLCQLVGRRTDQQVSNNSWSCLGSQHPMPNSVRNSIAQCHIHFLSCFKRIDQVIYLSAAIVSFKLLVWYRTSIVMKTKKKTMVVFFFSCYLFEKNVDFP